MTTRCAATTSSDFPPDEKTHGTVMTMQGERVCHWHLQMPDYHADEWGRPVTDDKLIFEKVCLESFQSGLSWHIVLHKRAAFREAFCGFDFYQLADFSAVDIESLLKNPAIIRNRRKIVSAIHNAQRAIALVSEAGSLAAWFWQFEPPPEARPKEITQEYLSQHPDSAASRAMARGLKQRGWTWVGPVTCYSLMQALGLVNDHLQGCCYRNICESARAELIRPWLKSE
ncbi:MAG: DNA-3-methyladenine glycosylase 1 [Candidatus Erwinia impunctatus]|nr:DNA-3-methyladenine glycosylase 1 [Culicoides impunctatus]